MNFPKRSWTSLVLIISGMILLNLSWAWIVQAQVASNYLRITEIDISRFPDVTVTLYGQGLAGELDTAEIQLLENGQPQDLDATSVEEIGAQISLVVDASNNISAPGQTGSTRLEEVSRIAGDLVQSQILLDGKDYLNAIAFNREDNQPVPAVLENWSPDHQGVINQIIAYSPSPANINTPLIQQIFFALEQFGDANLPANLQRHIVVFSDGTDILSGTEPEDLPRIAEELGVRVHTVWFRNGAVGAEANMRRIATLTGGEFFTITTENPLPVQIWQAIQATQRQRVMTYRSSNPSPQQVTATALSVSGSLMRAERSFPSLRILPAQIRIVQPRIATITRSGPAWDTNTSELMPNTMEAQLEIGWPDGRSRAVTRIEYLIDGTVLDPIEGSGLNVILPITSLDGGDHTLRIRVRDELGLIGESDPVNFEVVIDKPPAPDFEATATAEAAIAEVNRTADLNAAATREANIQANADTRATVQAEEAAVQQANAAATASALETAQITAQGQVRSLSYVSMVSTALGLAALVFAVIAWRNPRVRKRATEFVTGTIQAVTEPFFGGRGGGPPRNDARAHLVLVSGDSSIAQTIEIYKEITKIGRDAALVDAVINDRRVSRLHAKIVDKGSQFELTDEGSTSGTWVNDQQVPMQGHMLRYNDEINFGPIRYRFETLGGAEPTQTAVYAGVTEKTEPYVPTVGATTQRSSEDQTQIAHQANNFDNDTQYDFSNMDRDSVDSSQWLVKDDEEDGSYQRRR